MRVTTTNDEEKPVKTCMFCGAPATFGRRCNACQNDYKRRYAMDPMLALWKKFLGV